MSDNQQPLLLVLDVHALVHRAYHAVPPLTVRRTGEVVNAVFGVASMLLKALADYQPSNLAAANDLPGPTFRHASFEDYKAHRPAAADDLRPQFVRVRQLLEAFCIPIYEQPGYEADDVIGTLATQATARALSTVIVTGDNDALQLVNPFVRVLTPRRT
ncbi:MAG TPA: DNA polymerase I, partial [Dehalococcoidia bacterium]|nr:DNA polymerase I [Dehalococcoidia bacterium]